MGLDKDIWKSKRPLNSDQRQEGHFRKHIGGHSWYKIKGSEAFDHFLWSEYFRQQYGRIVTIHRVESQFLSSRNPKSIEIYK